MARPSFWDVPESARRILKRYSDVNQKSERMNKWEKLYNDVKSSIDLIKEGKHYGGKSRIRSQIAGLMKDLESAEMEILLEGKYDFADAFIILSAQEDVEENVKWMLELAGIYVKWARRRGYGYKIFGERLGDEKGENSILLYISGMNAFGLLKNERGIHRKTITRKAGKKSIKRSYDCSVLVLADVQPLEDSKFKYSLDIRKIRRPLKGWRMKSLSRHVLLKDPNSENDISFYSDGTIDADSNLPSDLFLSFLHYQNKRAALVGQEDKGVWGSVVRTYEIGDGSRVLDHGTNIIIKSVKDYLGGKIDSLLLERII